MIRILVAEDNQADANLIRQAVSDNPNFQTWFVNDGQEAIEFLLGENQFQEEHKFPRPDMILLDMNMPHVDGLAFLDWRRNEAPEFVRVIPTVVLSSSNDPADVWQAYALGANRYMTKPSTLVTLRRRFDLMDELWNYETELPPRQKPEMAI